MHLSSGWSGVAVLWAAVFAIVPAPEIGPDRALADPPVMAQVPAATDLPAAEAVIARSIEAVGGEEALLRQQSRRAVGAFRIPAQGIHGTVELLSARPNQYLLRVKIPGLGDIASGFDGEIGWIDQPMSGPMLLEGKALEELMIEADFDEPIKDLDQYASLTTVGVRKVEGLDCHVVEFVLPSGKSWVEFYDVEEGLPRGREGEQETPMGAVQVFQTFTDYKDFDGLLFPMTVTQSMMGMDQIIAIETLTFDDVDESEFALPSVIRALVEEDDGPGR